jgi:RNA polymerase sigma-70 factor, ECF subfamily
VTSTTAGAAARESLSRALVDHGDRLYSLALRITRDPDMASDAVQEAFATALARAADFRGDSAPGTWLHRIVYTKSVDLLRRRGRETALPDEDAAGSGDEDGPSASWSRPPDEVLYGAETRAALMKALDVLTPLQRAVFTMRELEDRTTDEVAEVLDLPSGTVRVHLHRARMKLRSVLAPHFRGTA